MQITTIEDIERVKDMLLEADRRKYEKHMQNLYNQRDRIVKEYETFYTDKFPDGIVEVSGSCRAEGYEVRIIFKDAYMIEALKPIYDKINENEKKDADYCTALYEWAADAIKKLNNDENVFMFTLEE